MVRIVSYSTGLGNGEIPDEPAAYGYHHEILAMIGQHEKSWRDREVENEKRRGKRRRQKEKERKEAGEVRHL